MINEKRLDKRFPLKLIDWYRENRRKLPWRETKDPYPILVSEIMLQQTQVSTVIPYFLRFMETLPTIKGLAEVSDDELHRLWEGLGYYSRASRLRQLAKVVVDDFAGVIPSDKETLMKLPGIGPYTCGAVLSFAFDQKEPAVDGNVKRVIARLLNDDQDIMKAMTTKFYTEELIKVLPDDIYDFNQGMIELGALVCKPKNPECLTCPLRAHCRALVAGTVDSIPVKKKKAKQIQLRTPVFIIREKDKILFVRREESGLLSGLYGLPMIEKDVSVDRNEIELADYLMDNFEYSSDQIQIKFLGQVKHVFSHRIWLEQVFLIDVEGLVEKTIQIEYPIVRWSQVDDISIPTAFKKALALLERKG